MLLKKKQKPRLTFNSGLVLICVEKLVYFSCLPLATFSCPSSTFVSTSHIILLNENMKKSGVVSIQGMSTLKALYFYNNYVNVAHILFCRVIPTLLTGFVQHLAIHLKVICYKRYNYYCLGHCFVWQKEYAVFLLFIKSLTYLGQKSSRA